MALLWFAGWYLSIYFWSWKSASQIYSLPPPLLCSHSPTLGSNAIELFEVNPLCETNVCFSWSFFTFSPGTSSLTRRLASHWGGRSFGFCTTLERSPTVLQVSVCVLSAVSLFSSSRPLPFELKQLCYKEKSGHRIHPHIVWLTRLISHLKLLPCCEVPVEQRWQPERFLFLPGFLDKNNDLLFRNLKEVSVDRGCFQYSAEQGVGFRMGWHLREKILLDSTWRMCVHGAALWKDKLRCPKFILLLKSKAKQKNANSSVPCFFNSSLKNTLLYLWKCLSLQTMCNSENPIINQCFDRTELTDKKRPETVRTQELDGSVTTSSF